MNKDYEKLIQYALRIISKKRYTEREIRMKLGRQIKKHKLVEETADEVVERLKELKYVDDTKYVIDFANERIKFRPRGSRMIKMELRMKGISKETIDVEFDKIDIDEKAIAVDFLKRRQQRLKKYPEKLIKTKAYQLLYSKGFERDAIYKAIADCYNYDD